MYNDLLHYVIPYHVTFKTNKGEKKGDIVKVNYHTVIVRFKDKGKTKSIKRRLNQVRED
jgi:hypothetical protein